MVDLSPIQKYITELDKQQTDFVIHEINSVGLDKFLEYNFRVLDCSRISKDGLRLMQTIGYPYIHVISETIYVINNYIEEDKQDEYLTELLELHDKNVEYEKINPPIWYGGEKAKRAFEKKVGDKTSAKPKRKRVKQQELDFPDAPKKQTAAEKKLAAKVAKINALSFKIKPQN